MRKIVLGMLISSVLFISCLKSSVNTACKYDACATKAPSSEITEVEAYLSGAGITTAVKHCSGMYYQVINPGADKTPTVCSNLTVKYTGRLTNGTVFDQSNSFSYNLSQLINGWKNGIPLIKKGGSIKLYIPPTLGYGAQAVGPIPANSMLIFDIELVDVQ